MTDFGARRAVGIALPAHALLQPREARPAALREAGEVLADSPARLEHARALVDLGAALRRANRRRDAQRSARGGGASARWPAVPSPRPDARRRSSPRPASGVRRPAAAGGRAPTRPSHAQRAPRRRPRGRGLTYRQIAQSL